MEWRWANEHRIFFALDKVTDPEVVDDILDALDEVLADPYGLWSAPMQGNRTHSDRLIAALPHGWYIVFTPQPQGAWPAMKSPALVVHDCRPFLDPDDTDW